MKARNALLGLGAGLVAGILLSPKKGSESYEELKRKLNNIYLQAKELNLDDIKNNVEDLRIELTKLDATKSKEIVNDQSAKIKSTLDDLIDKLQNNENIKPTLNSAVSSLENGIIEVINWFDGNDFAEKAKDKTEVIREKASELAAEVKEKSKELSEKALEKKDEILGKADQTVDYLEKDVLDRKDELEHKAGDVDTFRDSSKDDIKKVIDEANAKGFEDNIEQALPSDIDESVREKVKQVNKDLNK